LTAFDGEIEAIHTLHYFCWTYTRTNMKELLSFLTQRLQYYLRDQQKLWYQQKPKTARS